MDTYKLNSYYVTNEISLNDIAKHFGINKKFKWEEPLTLKSSHLKGVLMDCENKMVFIYFFGSIVFVNFTIHEANDLLNYLKNIDKNLKNSNLTKYREEFKLIADDKVEEDVLSYDSVIINHIADYHVELISTILAKSVALETIEVGIDKVTDEIEDIIEDLNSGRLKLKDEQLAKISGKILTFKYNTISTIMLLEKPDIAWNIEEAENFFSQLSGLFELSDRYDKIKHKTETLLDITEVFTGLSQAKQGRRLELIVIILILMELIISITEFIIR